MQDSIPLPCKALCANPPLGQRHSSTPCQACPVAICWPLHLPSQSAFLIECRADCAQLYCAQHLHNIVPTICTILCADDVVSDIKTVWHLGIHGIKDIFFIAFSSPVIAFTCHPWAFLQAIASLFIYHS